MIELVRVDDIASPRQRRDSPDICEVAAAEQQSSVCCLEARKIFLERDVICGIPSDESCGARAERSIFKRGAGCGGNPRIGGESEVIIRSEVDDSPAIYNNLAVTNSLDGSEPTA